MLFAYALFCRIYPAKYLWVCVCVCEWVSLLDTPLAWKSSSSPSPSSSSSSLLVKTKSRQNYSYSLPIGLDSSRKCYILSTHSCTHIHILKGYPCLYPAHVFRPVSLFIFLLFSFCSFLEFWSLFLFSCFVIHFLLLSRACVTKGFLCCLHECVCPAPPSAPRASVSYNFKSTVKIRTPNLQTHTHCSLHIPDYGQVPLGPFSMCSATTINTTCRQVSHPQPLLWLTSQAGWQTVCLIDWLSRLCPAGWLPATTFTFVILFCVCVCVSIYYLYRFHVLRVLCVWKLRQKASLGHDCM